MGKDGDRADLSQHMISTEINGIPCFRFSHLAGFPELRHAIFTRRGGCSTGPFRSLNVGRSVGDRADAVAENRERIAACMDRKELVLVHQVHGKDVLILEKGRMSDFSGEAPPRADALVTSDTDISLMIQTADCQAVLLYDPAQRVAGNIHSGWRGSVQNIIGHTIQTMIRHFGSDPETIYAGIGPSLGPCCAEFVNYRTEIPESLWPYRDERDRFDFWAISRDQLTAAGVLPAHIRTAGLCTRCRTDLFYSYRGEGRTGRFAAVIGMQ